MQFPSRVSIGESEIREVGICLDYYRSLGKDPEYQGEFERRYLEEFCSRMGGGYGDCVSTGSLSLWVALRAFEGISDEVLMSPITDPGCVSAAILAGFRVRLVDGVEGGYGVGELPDGKLAVVVHSLGRGVRFRKGLVVVEDCSQAHFARVDGEVVGRKGNVACFSTMARKAHVTGGCGGVVWTEDLNLHRKMLAFADRGKPRWVDGFDDRDPRGFLFPALNLHQDEISCAIGLSSLRRFDESRSKRLAFVKSLSERVEGTRFRIDYSPEDSPFAIPVFVDGDGEEFGLKLRERGVPLNPRYRYLCCEWPWLEPYLVGDKETPIARKSRDSSFVLYLNENYGEKEAEYISNLMRAL